MNRILVALDVDSRAKALALADALRGAVAGYKIGKQLFTAEGPDMVRALTSRGDRVFLDLKFHDIPNTVAGAVSSAIGTGAWMVNVHAPGGSAMMRAAAEAARTAAEKAGAPRPLVIGVTVLTSMDDAALAEVCTSRSVLDQVVNLATLARASGLDGVVASPHEIGAIRSACGPDFVVVAPGMRPAGQAGKDDQAPTLTPAGAVAPGEDQGSGPETDRRDSDDSGGGLLRQGEEPDRHVCSCSPGYEKDPRPALRHPGGY